MNVVFTERNLRSFSVLNEGPSFSALTRLIVHCHGHGESLSLVKGSLAWLVEPIHVVRCGYSRGMKRGPKLVR